MDDEVLDDEVLVDEVLLVVVVGMVVSAVGILGKVGRLVVGIEEEVVGPLVVSS